MLILFARFFLCAPTFCIPLGSAAYVILTSSFGQLHLFLALGKALFLLFADSTKAMMAGQTFSVGLQSFFLFGDWHTASMALVIGAAL